MAKKTTTPVAFDANAFFGAAEQREVAFTAGTSGTSINESSKVDINGKAIHPKMVPANNGVRYAPGTGTVTIKLLPFLDLIKVISNYKTPEVKTKWVTLPKNLLLTKEKALEIPELVERANQWFSETDKPMPNFAYHKVLANGVIESVVAKVEERSDKSGNKFKQTVYYKQLDNHPVYLTRVGPGNTILTEEDLQAELIAVPKHNEAVTSGKSKADLRKVRFFKNPYDENDTYVYWFSDSKETLYYERTLYATIIVGKKLSEAGAEDKDRMFLLVTAGKNKLVTRMSLTSHGASSFTANKMAKKIKELPEHIGLTATVLNTQLVDWTSRVKVRIESEAGTDIFGESPAELVFEIRPFKAPRTTRIPKAAVTDAANPKTRKPSTRKKPAVDKEAAVVKNVSEF